MVDNGLTPHLIVAAGHDGVDVPEEHVRDGKIVLNVSPSATRGLALANDFVRFEARFRGTPRTLAFPVAAVLGIYARETGQGMLFSDDATPPGGAGPEGAPPPTGTPPAGDAKPGPRKAPKLTVIK